MKKVEQADIDRVLEQFDHMDQDKSGTLTIADLKMLSRNRTLNRMSGGPAGPLNSEAAVRVAHEINRLGGIDGPVSARTLMNLSQRGSEGSASTTAAAVILRRRTEDAES